MSDSPTKKKLSPLHTHSVYSVLDGASSIDSYIEWCIANGAKGLALTDHGWVIGALELYNKCKKAGITPLPGCEFYLAPHSDHVFNGKPYDYYHITVWATSEVGYRNLIKLGSMAWNQDTIPGWKKNKETLEFDRIETKRVTSKFGGLQLKPRITFDELLNNHEGLVIGTGCLIGSLSKCFLKGEFKEAEKNLMRLLEVFKGRCFAEIMPHSCTHDYSRTTKSFEPNECTDFSPDGNLQKACNEEIVKIARKYDIPLLMTIDSHFTEPELHKIQSILLSNGDPDGWRFHQSYHMLTTEQAWDMWTNMHGDDREQRMIFQEAVENNDVIVDMAKDISITDEYQQPAPDFPIEIIEKELSPSEARKALLFQKIEEHGRMKWENEEWLKRLMYELSVICDNGTLDFADYFIFLEKVYSWARANSIFAGPGRGSGAGSLLCYLLKITSIDPFRFKLPFERFLSAARIKRGKWPDIDCDFGDRDLLVSYLREEYGDKMAQCSTLGTLKVKSAIKDVCRSIMGWNGEDERVKRVTSTIPNEPQGVNSKDFLLGYEADGVFHNGHILDNPVLDEFFKAYPVVYNSVMELLGVPRSVGRHACFDENTLVDNNGKVSKIKDASFIGNKKVTVWETGRRETILVCFDNGTVIRSTPEHVFFTTKGEVEAKDLKGLEMYHSPFTKTSGDVSIDHDLAFSLGFCLNDSSFNRGSQTHSGAVHFTEDKDEEAKTRVLDYFTKAGVTFSQDEYRKDQYNIGDVNVSEYFYESGNNLEQRLPDYFWTLDVNSQLSFMRGLFSANGYVLNTHPRLGIKLSSKLLASDICIWLNSHGVETSATYTGKKKEHDLGGDIASNGGSSDINIVDRSSKRWFLDNVGFEQKYKTDRLIEIVNNTGPHEEQSKKAVKCIAIEESTPTTVYDFNEPTENRAFVSGILAHNSAFFISHKPIWESVPTCYISGHLCTQYQTTAANNMAEKAGLIKFDFLTVRTLKDIASAARLIQAKYGYKTWEEKMVFGSDEYNVVKGELSIDQLPMPDGRILDLYDLPEDAGVFDDLCRGKTESVFQMNSTLMTGQTMLIRPSKIQHTSDIVALVRPGPLLADTGVKMTNESISAKHVLTKWPVGSPRAGEDKDTYTMTELYIEAKNGRAEPTYAHPGMEPILKETYGSAAYQEQLQQMFVDLAGYTLEEADYLREVLAKKKRQEMEKSLPDLKKRLESKGWNQDQIDVFVSLCISSSAYSFNKAHSASYGMVAYQCAFLKHHFPTEWWTAVLQNASIDDIKEKGYANLLIKEGVLELPNVNGPTDTFRPSADGKVHSPLYLIDRIGGAACRAIQEARDEGGPFTSFQDFFERACGKGVNEAVVSNLIICDSFKGVDDRSARELISDYYYLKRVTGLAIGKIKQFDGTSIPKKGEELLKAVEDYKLKEKAKGSKLEIPVWDSLDMEVTKARILPIYRLNIHEKFQKLLESMGVIYQAERATFRVGMYSMPVFRDLSELKRGVTGERNDKYIWAGIITSSETFQYTDKKTRKKVTALKMLVANSEDQLECIMWPDTYTRIGDPDTSKVAMVMGNIRESYREPGVYNMTIDEIIYI